MVENINIRPERDADIDAIVSVTKQAFLSNPFSQGTEQYVIDALRGSGALSICLVAEIDGQVVGHSGRLPF